MLQSSQMHSLNTKFNLSVTVKIVDTNKKKEEEKIYQSTSIKCMRGKE